MTAPSGGETETLNDPAGCPAPGLFVGAADELVFVRHAGRGSGSRVLSVGGGAGTALSRG